MPLLINHRTGIPATVRVESATYTYVPRRRIPPLIITQLGFDTDNVSYRTSEQGHEAFYVTPYDANCYISACTVTVIRSISSYAPAYPGICILFEPCELRQFGGGWHFCLPGWRLDMHGEPIFHACDFWIPCGRVRLFAGLARAVTAAGHVSQARSAVCNNYRCVLHLSYSMTYRSLGSMTDVQRRRDHLAHFDNTLAIQLNGYMSESSTDDSALGEDWGLAALFYIEDSEQAQGGQRLMLDTPAEGLSWAVLCRMLSIVFEQVFDKL